MTHGARGLLALALLAPAAARAEHRHDPREVRGDPARHFEARLGVVAASYRSPLFDGSYQGVTATAGWTGRRFAVSAGLPLYRIDRNGKVDRGLGDATLHGLATLLARPTVSLGAVVMVMLPTGSDRLGLGMGHAMLMPGAWAVWSPRPLTVAASAGYARGLGGAGAHAHHASDQPWPLVDPMNFAEVTFDGSAMVALARGLGVGLRAAGAVPAGDGQARALGGVRASWREGRVETTAELQAGFAAEPFRLRGLVAVSMRL